MTAAVATLGVIARDMKVATTAEIDFTFHRTSNAGDVRQPFFTTPPVKTRLMMRLLFLNTFF
jgi:hypothetical protein